MKFSLTIFGMVIDKSMILFDSLFLNVSIKIETFLMECYEFMEVIGDIFFIPIDFRHNQRNFCNILELLCDS